MSIDPRTYEHANDVLKDRIILITGSTDGIGRALALHIAGLGAQVILHGRNTKKLEAIYDDIESIQGAPRPSIAVVDLAAATGDDYANLARSVDESFGRLDGLVHNAGILGQRLSIEQYDPDEWQQVLHVNLTAPFVMTQGGPAGTTRVMSLIIYQTAFAFNRLGRASAMAVVLFLIILGLTLIQTRLYGTEAE